ncbi:MAG: class I SAM-dependent methyltransferase [Ferruginibacter sp.]|nr:class I SAM-dependent methyltransferase [Ferruginibacter sp.]
MLINYLLQLSISGSDKCKICGESRNIILYTINQFDIIKCSQCDLVFTSIPEEFDLSEIYDESYFQGGQKFGYGNYAASEKVLRIEFRKSVRLIKKFISVKNKPKLLELGSAYGYFMDEVEQDFDCVGMELSETAINFARKRGHNVINDTYNENTSKSIGSIDVVAMFDVIEHLPDPISTLQLLNSHLNKDGIIIITTGNIDSFLARLMKKKWRLMTPPQHTFFFSKKTLSNIFRNMGYKIEILDSPWKNVPLGLAVYQLMTRMGFKLKISERLNRISLPINLFDTVRIVARKIH